MVDWTNCPSDWRNIISYQINYLIADGNLKQVKIATKSLGAVIICIS